MESLPLIAMFLFSNLLIKANIYFVIFFSPCAHRLNWLFVWAFFSLCESVCYIMFINGAHCARKNKWEYDVKKSVETDSTVRHKVITFHHLHSQRDCRAIMLTY